jgi:hypothetical protein
VSPGTECQALVNTTDLFATVVDLAGVAPSTAEDSVSLAPYLSDPELGSLRSYAFAEWYLPNGPGPGPTLERLRAARGNRFKLLSLAGPPGTEPVYEFYDLISDPLETHDLLAAGPLTPGASQAFDALATALDEHDDHQPWTDLGGSVPGSAGTPKLVGAGSLLAGEPYALLLVDSAPDTGGYLVVGGVAESLPFKGGVMIPKPEVVLPITTNGAGIWWEWSPSPSGLLPDLPIYWQCWIFDPGAPQQTSASNGLFVSTPGAGSDVAGSGSR